jgi:hypothetical protein
MNYTFLTDRLAVGDVASRSLPGFVAVVSLLSTERPGVICSELGATLSQVPEGVPVHWIDLADGEGPYLGPAHDRDGAAVPPHDLSDYLDEATQFIADHIVKGAVLVHCGAGRSRSVAVVCAYLCRYVGMSWSEAINFVKQRRPEAAPASCFHDAVTTWLRLDELAATGPRGGSATQQTA